MNEDLNITAELFLDQVIGLSNALFVGLEKVSPGELVSVLQCYRIWDHVNVELAIPGKGSGLWFSTKAYFNYGDTDYLTIMYPPEQNVDVEVPPEFMLAVLPNKNATPVSNEKLVKLVVKYQSIINSGKPIDYERMETTLGPITEWMDKEDSDEI